MSFRNSKCVPIKEGNSVIFYVNTAGFPLMDEVWTHMWKYAKELQPEATQDLMRIQENKNDLPNAEIPQPPYAMIYNNQISSVEKLVQIQNYINKLQYNHTGLQFFDIRKDRPVISLAEQARRIIENPLPIKCLEAVVVGIYLINEIAGSTLEKFTIGFKTSSHGNIHRHVVLGLYDHRTARFGALGLSRRADLGFKSLTYSSLTQLVLEYTNAYTKYLHRVRRIRIGMPIAKSNRSFECIGWNGVHLNLSDHVNEWTKLVEKHSRHIRHSSIDIKQATSLSLRHLNQISSSHTNKNHHRESGSYLKTYLEKSQLSLKQHPNGRRRKKTIVANISCDDLASLAVHTVSDSDEISDKSRSANNNSSVMPRTAPGVANNQTKSAAVLFPSIRKGSESVTTVAASAMVAVNRKKETRIKSIRI